MNDPLTTAIIIAMIPALVFAAFGLRAIINRRNARKDAATPSSSEAVTVVPGLPLLDVTLEIIMTDPASGKRYIVHFGVESVEMLEDE